MSPESARTLGQAGQHVVNSPGASVMPMSQAYPRQPAEDAGLIGVIEQVRADFEAFRLRLQREQAPTVVEQSPQAALQQLSESMDRAVRTQVDILEFGVTLNAGLTAAQQSQNSIKTLLEKS